jgi:thiamine biosynthesis lipoprotein ApbE
MRFVMLILPVLLLLAGCQPEERFHSFEFATMGTTASGEVGVWDVTQDRSPVDMIQATIDTASARLDAGRRGSVLDRLNNAPLDSTIQLDLWTSESLRIGEILRDVSDGAYDPSDGHPNAYTHDPFRRTVIRHDTSVRLDLGGVMKGYAIDRVVKNLIEMGISSAVVDLGGALFCLGVDDGEPWTIPLPDPRGGNEPIATVKTWNMAVATNRTGPGEILSVTVLTQQATMADGLANVLKTMRPEDAVELLQTRYSHVRAVLVLPGDVGNSLRMLATKSLRGNLDLTPESRSQYRLEFLP